MGYEEPHPRAIQATIITGKALVLAFFLLPVVAVIYGEASNWVERQRVEDEEVRTAEEWRKAVHQWNAGAQQRRAAQAEMEALRAEALATRKAVRNAR